MKPITYTTTQYGTAALLTEAELLQIIPQAAIDAAEYRGHMKTRGMWQIPVSYTAIAVDITNKTIYGPRTMTNIRQLGYEIEGYASIEGKKTRVFSSSLLVELPNKKLISIAILYVCSNKG